jgi:2-polyprenyl-3-methyl-5-hydroxy-6-metoxy-1,4-benzoquinol methylase
MGEIEFLSAPSSVSMADEWFQYAKPDHFWMRWRHCVLLQQLKRIDHQINNALEIGCGNGVVREMLERDLSIPVDGCDLNKRALEGASKGEGRLLIYDIFDQDVTMLNAYDAILLMDVIEHVDDDLRFLRASLNHLRRGGIVVINVPAHMLFYSKYDEVAGHKRRYSRSDIRTLLRATDVQSISLVEWGFSLVALLLMRKLVLRFVSHQRTIQTGFAPPNKFFRGALDAVQAIETHLPFSMPFGSSILAIGRKMS